MAFFLESFREGEKQLAALNKARRDQPGVLGNLRIFKSDNERRVEEAQILLSEVGNIRSLWEQSTKQFPDEIDERIGPALEGLTQSLTRLAIPLAPTPDQLEQQKHAFGLGPKPGKPGKFDVVVGKSRLESDKEKFQILQRELTPKGTGLKLKGGKFVTTPAPPHSVDPQKAQQFLDINERLKQAPDSTGDIFKNMLKVTLDTIGSGVRGAGIFADSAQNLTDFQIQQLQAQGLMPPGSAKDVRASGEQKREVFKGLAEKIYSFSSAIEADPKTGKFAKDIESFRDFVDIERMGVALGENAGQLAMFMGAALINPLLGGAFMFAVESGDAARSIDIYEQETGKKLDADHRLALESIVGSLNMALDLVPILRMLKIRNLPGFRKKIVSIFLTTFLESGTEGTQEVVQMAAELQYKGKIEDLQAAMQRVLQAMQAGMAFGLFGGVVGAALSGRDTEAIARRAVAKQKLKEELAKQGEKQDTSTKSLLERILGPKRQLKKPKPEGGRKAVRLPEKQKPGTVVGAKLPAPEKPALPSEVVLPEAQPIPDDLSIDDLKLAAQLSKNPDDFLKQLDDFEVRPESIETFVQGEGFKDVDDFFTKAREEKSGKPTTPQDQQAIDDFVEKSEAEPAIIDNQGVIHSSDTAKTVDELLSQLELKLDDIADSGIITKDGQFVSKDKIPELAKKLKPKSEIKPAAEKPTEPSVPTKPLEPTEPTKKQKFFERLIQKMKLENEGQDRLDDLIEEGANPRQIGLKFFRETFDKIPEKAKKNFIRLTEDMTGIDITKPGNLDIVIKDFIEDLPEDLESMDKAEQGWIIIMEEGNKFIEGGEKIADTRTEREPAREAQAQTEAEALLEPEETPAEAPLIKDFTKPKPFETLGPAGDLVNIDDRISEKLDTDIERGIYSLIKNAVNIAITNAALQKINPGIAIEQLQEKFEKVQVIVAREHILRDRELKAPLKFTYDKLKLMYRNQPTLGARTSTKLNQQQFSTPIHLAFLMGEILGVNSQDIGLDTTAGNGALLANFPIENAIANELTPGRVKNLKDQGIKTFDVDAAKFIIPIVDQVDAVIINPPFNNIPKTTVQGFVITKLEHQIAMNALQHMTDNGRASILLGGNAFKTNFGKPSEIAEGLRIFLNFLHANYNVTGHFNLAENVFGRQGTTFPTQLITIHGRRKAEKFAPTSIDEITDIQSLDQLREIIERRTEHGLLRALGLDELGRIGGINRNSLGLPENIIPDLQGRTEGEVGGIVGEEPRTEVADTGLDRDRGRGRPEDVGRPGDRGPGDTKRRVDTSIEQREGVTAPEVDTGERETIQEPVRSLDAEPLAGTSRIETSKPLDPKTAEAHKFGTREQPSVLASKGEKLNTTMPSNTVKSVTDALSKIPNIDQFLVDELGYPDIPTLYEALGAEQIDDIGLALTKMKAGGGMIIGDQTGIGKGRVAAALLRWSVKQGRQPIFFTQKATLFSDLYRDLRAIGSGNLIPFIVNGQNKKTDPTIRNDETGKILFKPLDPKFRKTAFDQIVAQGRNCKCLKNVDIVVVTYSQVNRPNIQRTALRELVEGNDLILDESHTAAGASQTGEFFIENMIKRANAITYLSATYAKRADNLPVYAKTILGTFEVEQLASAFDAGKIPLQEVVASALAGGGEYIRHERTWDGVEYNIEVIPRTEANQIGQKADDVTKVLRTIVSMDQVIKRIVEVINRDIRKEGKRARIPQEMLNRAVSTPFASRVHNLVGQLLLALKVDDTILRTIDEIKAGRKPIIALTNTMESFLNDFINVNDLKKGDIVDMDFTNVLDKALTGQLEYKVKHPDGSFSVVPLPLNEFPELQELINTIRDDISDMFKGLTANPIDMIKSGLKAKGYRVGELTGRNWEVIDGRLEIRQEIDKFDITSMFNGNTPKGRKTGKGEIDVLIANRSASTGISLHASKDFGDQRQRVMIMIQPDPDINQVMQIFGRIFRTGQVHDPKYRLIQLDLPTEIRPAAVLSHKMASLNATVTANQEGATSLDVPNFFNEVGDEVAREMIREMTMPEMQNHFGKSWDLSRIEERAAISDITAQKATGWLQLAPISIQTEFLEALEEAYDSRIDELTARGMNPLIAQNLDYKAKSLSKELTYSGEDQNNPLTADAFIEQLEVDILAQPLSRDFIQEKIADPARDETNAEIEALKKQGDTWYKKRILQAKSLDAEKSLTDRWNVETGHLNGVINRFPIGTALEVTVKVSGELAELKSTQEVFTGVVMGFKHSKTTDSNPIAPSKNALIIGTNDPQIQKITVPLSQIGFGRRVDLSPTGKRGVPDNWEDTKKTGARETVQVWTGNLFAYYATDNSENSSRRNTIIRFTMEDGTVREGIVLHDRDLDTIDTNQVIVKDVNQAINYLQQGNDLYPVNDPNVQISFFSNIFEIKVPDTRIRGSKYFSNEQLLNIVDNREMTPTKYNQNGHWRSGLIGIIQSRHLPKFKDVLSKEFGFQFALPRDFVEANKPKVDSDPLYSMGIFPDPRAVFKYLLPAETRFKLAQGWSKAMRWLDFFPVTGFQAGVQERGGLINAGHEYAAQMKLHFERELNDNLFGIKKTNREARLNKEQEQERRVFTMALTLITEVRTGREIMTLGDARQGGLTGDTLEDMQTFLEESKQFCTPGQCVLLEDAFELVKEPNQLLRRWHGILKADIQMDRGLLQNSGLLNTFYENYINHIWKLDPKDNFLRAPGAKGLTKSLVNARRRKISSYMRGMALGYVPKTLNPFELNEIRKKHMVTVLANKAFLDFVGGLEIDGLPAFIKPKLARSLGVSSEYTNVPDHPALRFYQYVGGQTTETIQMNDRFQAVNDLGIKFDVRVDKVKTERTFFAQSQLLVHRSIASQLKAIYTGSIFREFGPTRWYLKINQFQKLAKLSFSGFHHIALGMNNFFLGGKYFGNPLWFDIGKFKSMHKDGLKQIEEFNPILFQGVKQGLTLNETGSRADYFRMTQKLEDAWDKTEPTATMQVIKNNLGGFREWWDYKLWNKYYAGSKAMAFLVQYAMNLNRFAPNFEREHSHWVGNGTPLAGRTNYEKIVAKVTARDMNDLYGGIPRDMLGISETMFDFLRGIVLAPDWQISNWRYTLNAVREIFPQEVRAYLVDKDGARVITGKSKGEFGKKQALTLTKGAFKTYLKAFFVLTLVQQGVNWLMTKDDEDEPEKGIDKRGKTTFENPPGYKHLTKIGRIAGQEYYIDLGRHFWEPWKLIKGIDPTADFPENILSVPDAFVKYLRNKQAIMPRALTELATMKDWRGRGFADYQALKAGKFTVPEGTPTRWSSQLPGWMVQQLFNITPIPAEAGFRSLTGDEPPAVFGFKLFGMHIKRGWGNPEVRDLMARIGPLTYKERVGIITPEERLELRFLRKRLVLADPGRVAERKLQAKKVKLGIR